MIETINQRSFFFNLLHGCFPLSKVHHWTASHPAAKGPSKLPVQLTSSLFKPSADWARYTAYLGLGQFRLWKPNMASHAGLELGKSSN